MRFDVSFQSPLTGRTHLPGDLKITLSVMALGMLLPEPLTIVNPSPSPDVTDFMEFLKKYGAEIHDVHEGFSIRGKLWDKDLTIGDEVTDDVIHLVISSAVFSGQSVKILNVTEERLSKIKYLKNILQNVGLTDEHITEEGNDITIKGTAFVPDAYIDVRSTGAFEALSASALASRSEVTLSYPAQAASHTVRLLTLLGYQNAPAEDKKSSEVELERRLAKAAGETPLEMRRFEWTGKPQQTIHIPGDTSLAAAVAGMAAVIPKSDVILEDVLWEIL